MKTTIVPRLLIMMFLQYFVQGAWNMTLGLVLSTSGLSSIIGTSYALLGIATILSPLFIGMVADRFIASQKIMGILHIVNACVLLAIPAQIQSGNATMFLVLLFIVGVLFYPTTGLSNSISFRHIHGAKTFPVIRVFGTFGFMVIGFLLGQMGFSGSIMTFKIAAISAIVLGIYCFTLPNTPAAGKGKKFLIKDLLCLDALALFKDKNFTVFMGCTIFLMIPKTAYSAYVPVFLGALGFNNAATIMQIGIATEVIFMFLLSLFLFKFGFKKIILWGAITWVLRSLLFSFAAVDAGILVIVIALALQGICWDFFFTAGDIYVDNKADVTIKAQAQSLKFMISNGLGLLFASSVTGYIFNHTVVDQGAAALKQWQQFWIYPAVVAAVVALVFFLFFKDKGMIFQKKNAEEGAVSELKAV
ncbi:MFS transporter [Paenibacillus chitinolyticus]|uniref:MFS transporter n=1 Tax=Paenibacillus chitinolyticus TaxID=79263 RepID=A0A410WWC9_9BACL|nr:MFS transporter [Paenibacillus chitinolyticus]MCY9591114.1 MFS transporter [Paenibacillus chitinolyticus]MCY9598664.1 MFS transporter [Paenibacillus chitinolyticus]QAV18715.1 MFS transporter [Paenibacillus chitinolyticus]